MSFEQYYTSHGSDGERPTLGYGFGDSIDPCACGAGGK